MDKNEIVRELSDCALWVNQNLSWALTDLPMAFNLRAVSARLIVVADAVERAEADAKLAEARALVAAADGVAKTEQGKGGVV